jgi:uncharacterized protein YdhG (YjbR/CyaY superfamily)
MLHEAEASSLVEFRPFAFCQEAGSIVPFLEKELADFDAEGGTIRFQPDHVIPDAVVRQIVRLRREQIESKLKR